MSSNVSRETIVLEPVVEPITSIEQMVGKAYRIEPDGKLIILYVVGRSNPRATPNSPAAQSYTVVEYKSDSQAIRINRHTTTIAVQQWTQGATMKQIEPREFVEQLNKIVLDWAGMEAESPPTP